MRDVVAVGACIGLIVVCMILMLGQSRVAFAMARDGLLPRGLARTPPALRHAAPDHPDHRLVVAVLAGFLDLETLSNLVNIGTLFAFILVSIGVVVLRRNRPDLPRAFRTPAVPVVATLSVLMCGYLMLNLTGETWERFAIWMAIGFVVYFAYGTQPQPARPGGRHRCRGRRSGQSRARPAAGLTRAARRAGQHARPAARRHRPRRPRSRAGRPGSTIGVSVDHRRTIAWTPTHANDVPR